MKNLDHLSTVQSYCKVEINDFVATPRGFVKNFKYKQEFTKGWHERHIVEPFKVNSMMNESLKKRKERAILQKIKL
jgi:hypothetical protein